MASLSPTGQAARKIVRKFPEASTAALARMLVRDNPLLFTDFEHARGILRDVRGANGNRRRPFAVGDPSPFSDLLKQIPAAKRLHDASPYKIHGVTKLGIIGDLHVPYHSSEAVHAAFEHLHKAKINGLLWNGDGIDNHNQSKYQPHPEARKFAEEAETMVKLLTLARKMFPKIWMGYKFGNHDERHELFLWRKCPEIFGHPNFQLENILKLKELGIKVIRDKRTVLFGDLAILHGHEYKQTFAPPVNPARWLRLRAKSHALVHHFHSQSVDSGKDIHGNSIACWSSGCLCDLQPLYAPFNEWTHGFAIAEQIGKESKFRLELKHISDTGKVY